MCKLFHIQEQRFINFIIDWNNSVIHLHEELLTLKIFLEPEIFFVSLNLYVKKRMDESF